MLNVKFNVTNGTNDPKVDALSLSQMVTYTAKNNGC
jgi:hypothetical protein